MKFLVTGGAGFIGQHVVAALAERGEAVLAVDRRSPNAEVGLEDVRYEEIDIRNREAIDSTLAEVDTVLHLAAIVSVPTSISRPLESHSVNIEGFLNVLEAAREHDTRVVFASSAALYGHPEHLPITESHPARPASPYGLEKLAGDHYSRLYHELFGVETVSLRYFNVYGPGQTGGAYAGVISTFIEQALEDEPITIHGTGEQTRDFVFVDDIVAANLVAAETPHVGEAYNIATGESVTILELAKRIRRLADSDSNIVHMDAREGDIQHSVADVSKASEYLDFEPSTNLAEGLKRTISWWKSAKVNQG